MFLTTVALACLPAAAWAADRPVGPPGLSLATYIEPEPDAAGARVRALERRTEGVAWRLGIAPVSPLALPADPAALAERERVLSAVAAFLLAGREELRPRLRASHRPAGRATRVVAVRPPIARQAERLGLARPAPGATGMHADPAVTAWLAGREEMLRDAESPLTRPVPGGMTSSFGRRWGRPHEGIDFAGDNGDPVRAAAPGQVVFARSYAGYGNLVLLDHDGDLQTAYGHMSAIAVARGDRVAGGQVIGRVGSTGHSTGPHLHFETRVRGRAADPAPYLRGAPRAPRVPRTVAATR